MKVKPKYTALDLIVFIFYLHSASLLYVEISTGTAGVHLGQNLLFLVGKSVFSLCYRQLENEKGACQ